MHFAGGCFLLSSIGVDNKFLPAVSGQINQLNPLDTHVSMGVEQETFADPPLRASPLQMHQQGNGKALKIRSDPGEFVLHDAQPVSPWGACSWPHVEPEPGFACTAALHCRAPL